MSILIRKIFIYEMGRVAQIINDNSDDFKRLFPQKKNYVDVNFLINQHASGVQFWGAFNNKNRLYGLIAEGSACRILNQTGMRLSRYYWSEKIMSLRRNMKVIHHLYIDSEYRRQGIGSKLLEYANDDKNDSILVFVWSNAVGAKLFYTSHRFKEIRHKDKKGNAFKKYFGVQSDMLDKVSMYLDLMIKI